MQHKNSYVQEEMERPWRRDR